MFQHLFGFDTHESRYLVTAFSRLGKPGTECVPQIRETRNPQVLLFSGHD
jgi:hypothetical protein